MPRGGSIFDLLMYTPILAHFGHWYISLPTFMGPVLIIVIVLKVSARRERRRARSGDASHSRVELTQGGDQAVVTVTGALDYPALLDIEHELGVAIGNTRHVLLDLCRVTSVEQDFAWSLPEIISKVDHHAEIVTVAIGTEPAAQALKKVCELEGVRLVEGAAVRSGPQLNGSHTRGDDPR
jgi:hypothetical protein